ncbi:MAG: hypothetical protein HGA98_00715 [Deltaproteobacteria bacterium]|nr:hypothetical protein [Deltaproteobacteria bacterium]
MSDLRSSLGELAEEVGDLRAVVVFEASGVEVAAWGAGEPEAPAAELASVWGGLSASETVLSLGGALDSVEVRTRSGTWVVLPLGADYLLGLLVGSEGLPGRARFCGVGWAHRHREEFS